MKNGNGFTLVEMVVWVTISLLLMLSVSIFVSSGMENIFIQQKVLKNNNNFNNFTNQINLNLNYLDNDKSIIMTSSGVIFKRSKYFSEWWFSYIWEEDLSWAYCKNDSETYVTKSLFIKNFIPFEEQGEDIFSNFNKILIWNISHNSETLISDQKNHIIHKSDWSVLVWKWIFWDKFEDWVSWTDIYLNSPTWLASDWINLYISDTLNNRILYLDWSNKIHKLLDETDWLIEPTWLFYDNNTLYIANSWKWEILEYSSNTTDKKLNFDFLIDKNLNKIKSFEIEFFPWITDISYPNSVSDINITWIIKYSDYLSLSTNKIKYYLSNFSNKISNQENQPCTWIYTKYNEVSWEIIKEELTSCSWTWTIRKYKHSLGYQDINLGTNIKITTNNNILWTDFSSNDNYYYKISFYWDDTYINYFPLFTQSDNDLTTSNDNTLKIFTSWLNYPTWIWKDWTIKFNDFLDWNYDNISYIKDYDTLLEVAIKNFSKDNSNDLLTLIIEYYKKYNCYNTDDKTEKTFITKKNLM